MLIKPIFHKKFGVDRFFRQKYNIQNSGDVWRHLLSLRHTFIKKQFFLLKPEEDEIKGHRKNVSRILNFVPPSEES